MQRRGDIRREHTNNSMVEQVSSSFYKLDGIMFVSVRSKSLANVPLLAQAPLYVSMNSIVYKNEKMILFTQDRVRILIN